MPTSQPLTAEIRTQIYRRMLLIRRTEERIERDYHLRQMRSPPHLYIGHEAVAAGVCTALRPTDYVYPYYRSDGWYRAKGGDLEALVGGTMPHATGVAWVLKRGSQDAVSDLRSAFEAGRVPDSFDDPVYCHVRRFRQLALR